MFTSAVTISLLLNNDVYRKPQHIFLSDLIEMLLIQPRNYLPREIKVTEKNLLNSNRMFTVTKLSFLEDFEKGGTTHMTPS